MKSPLGKITLVSTENAIIALYVEGEEIPKKLNAQKNETHAVLQLAKKQMDEYF